MRIRAFLALPVVLTAAALVPQASAAADPGVAALQVGLHARGLYRGPIDGITGPGTQRAIRRLQARARISVDGVVGPKTRRALGRFARHRLGSRPLRFGKAGWDVASLQFQLAEHGFPSGTFDGIFGRHIDAALRRFQEWAGLKADGVAGPATLGALTGPPPTIPLPLAWPMTAPVLGDLLHGHGERSMYAHLSRIDVRVGVRIGQGVRVGLVGATGDATGPHLHFEIRVRGACVNPLRALS